MDAPGRIATRYFLFGTAWILVSDSVLVKVFRDEDSLLLASASKGWLFMIVTTALLYAWVVRALSEQQALHRHALYLRRAFEAAADAVPARIAMVVFDARGTVVSANAIARAEFFAALDGAPRSGQARDDPAGRWIDAIQDELRSLDRASVDTRTVPFRDGPRTCRLAMGPMAGTDGEALGRFLILFDIQDLVDAEARASVQAAQYRLLFESNPEAMCLCEVGSLRILAVNAIMSRRYGFDFDGAPLSLHDLRVPAQPLGGMVALMGDQAATDRGDVIGAGVHLHRGGDGSTLQVDIEASRIDFDGQPRWLVLLRDVTIALRDRQNLQDQRESLQNLTRRTMREELSLVDRVTRVLHDRIANHLMLAGLNLEQFSRSTATHGVSRRDHLALAKAALEEAMTAVREGIHSLHPAVQLGAGLSAALRAEVDRLRAFTGAPLVELDGSCTGETRPTGVDQAVFLVAREALVNAVIHARATLIRTFIHCSADAVHLLIEDDGIGMSRDLVLRGRPGHLGMIGMSERAAAAGLRLSIEAAQPHGTRVLIHWSRSDHGEDLPH